MASQIRQIVDRGTERGETVPEVDAVMDAIVAPIIYRALFGPVLPTREQVRALVTQCVGPTQKAQPAGLGL